MGNYQLNGQYEYALVEMTGDNTPDMLVRALTRNGVDPVRVFSTTDGKNLNTSDDTLFMAAASADQERFGLVASTANDRIVQIQSEQVRPGTNAQDYVIRDGHLQKLSAGRRTWRRLCSGWSAHHDGCLGSGLFLAVRHIAAARRATLQSVDHPRRRR